ncbi:MAG: polyprenyl synthetase family protein [Planctomycetota bacterium]|jgi:geranylgeranyl pyrophosphate synthase
MNLEQIYRPIADDLKMVENSVASSIKESKNQSILAMSNFLLQSSGKRIRPALVILSERAASAGKNSTCNRDELINIATAVELIHMASLIHDDAIDAATMRHSKPSINAKWGNDVSIALGDYIYSKAFELIGKCKNPDVFSCISEAIYVMCEGELTQVCHRDNLNLSKDKYMVIIKKKTASLFAACCHAGTIIGNHNRTVQMALKEFGLNFGIAFQIIDDCKDIISEERMLGKRPGQDVIAGDMTLPLLTLLDVVGPAGREELKNMLKSKINDDSLRKIKAMIVDSDVLFKTQEVVASYINYAKERLKALADSDYKESFSRLTDCITQRTF